KPAVMFGASGSLPHRQLRKFAKRATLCKTSSLPHRQLRKQADVLQMATNGSLPHRQLKIS
ncbi:hypothetical protein, partial [Wohlfahrtiimonas chitiniclastica]|uniref:hypothetical protein n=1 Tax=Wohlfahrtiimonas chitiniclastica TaxID=400946 RepID=UPI0021578B80